MRIAELALRTGAQVEGDAEIEITAAAGLDEAATGQVTFLANPRYTPRVKTTRASAIYIGEEATLIATTLSVTFTESLSGLHSGPHLLIPNRRSIRIFILRQSLIQLRMLAQAFPSERALSSVMKCRLVREFASSERDDL